jgi:hypothetical protein
MPHSSLAALLLPEALFYIKEEKADKQEECHQPTKQLVRL